MCIEKPKFIFNDVSGFNFDSNSEIGIIRIFCMIPLF